MGWGDTYTICVNGQVGRAGTMGKKVIGSNPSRAKFLIGQFICLNCFGQKVLGTGSQHLLYVNKTTNCSVVYCGAHLETPNPSRI